MRLRTICLALLAIFLTIHVVKKQLDILRLRSRLNNNGMEELSVSLESRVITEDDEDYAWISRESFLSGSWRVPGKKYLFYQPSGGVSNQRILLENAVLIARRLNRTLILPPIGPHTNQWFKYNKVRREDVVNMLRLFDRNLLEKLVPVIALNEVSVQEFISENLENFESDWEIFAPLIGKKYTYTVARLENKYADCQKDVIFFSKGSLWKLYRMPPSELRIIRPYIRLNSEFRHIARKVSTETLGSFYNALHIRFPDVDGTNKRLGWLASNEDFIRRMIVEGYFNKTNSVYVATKPVARKHIFFSLFREKGFELLFSDSILESQHLKNFLSRFPILMSETILGLIEQLICSRGHRFLGTGYSTFSMYIRFNREQRLQLVDATLLPEFRKIDRVSNLTEIIHAFEESSSFGTMSEEIQKELDLIKMTTPCDKPMQVC